MRTNSRGCLSCQTGRVARARPPARIPLDFRGFQWERATGCGTTRRRRERRTIDGAFDSGCQARTAGNRQRRGSPAKSAAGAAHRIASHRIETIQLPRRRRSGAGEPRSA